VKWFLSLLGNKVYQLWLLVRPPLKWRIPVAMALGTFFGLGLTVIYISRAYSYVSEAPEVCMNCHIMAPEYATWQKSSHRDATCLDCHVPHDNFIRQYWFKGQDGMRHAFMFTFRMEPHVIRVHEPGMTVIQENCIRCHAFTVQEVSAREITLAKHQRGEGKLCWDCHRGVPHGTVHSLASVPHARVPKLTPITPEWLEKLLMQERQKQE